MLNILKKRQFKLLLACISLLLLLDLIQDTYAKYISGAEATADFAIARWAFLVNSQDVLDESDFSNTIVPTFDTNANIATGVIAPTSTGYFDIEIDSSDVDVSENIEVTPEGYDIEWLTKDIELPLFNFDRPYFKKVVHVVLLYCINIISQIWG